MKTPAWVTSVLIISCLLLIASCTTAALEEMTGDPDKVKIIATIFPLADIIENIGGELVEVTVLLRPGDSPHTFEPTVDQARAAAQAKLLFYIGEGLDDWALKLAGQEGIHTVQVTEHLQGLFLNYAPIHLVEEDHDDHQQCEHHLHTLHDPHIWMDPILVQKVIAPLVADKLTEALPQYESTIYDNLTQFQNELEELHQQITDMVSGFSQNRYISYHSAWNYFAYRYGLEEIASVEEFPGQEPSAKWLIELVRLAKEHQLDILFAEPQLNEKAAAVIADEIGGRVLYLDPLGGKEVPGRDSYLNLMRYNAGVFEEALR